MFETIKEGFKKLMTAEIKIDAIPDEAYALIFGATYRDVLSGFTGVLTCRVEHIAGCIQYELVPPGEGEKKPVEFFDWQRLEVRPEVPVIPFRKIQAVENVVANGRKVKDIITGFVGVVTSVAHQFDGSVLYGVTPSKLDDKGEYPNSIFIESSRVEELDTEIKVAPRKSVGTNGGPMRDMPRGRG